MAIKWWKISFIIMWLLPSPSSFYHVQQEEWSAMSLILDCREMLTSLQYDDVVACNNRVHRFVYIASRYWKWRKWYCIHIHPTSTVLFLCPYSQSPNDSFVYVVQWNSVTTCISRCLRCMITVCLFEQIPETFNVGALNWARPVLDCAITIMQTTQQPMLLISKYVIGVLCLALATR